jgi:hypothetical protein
VEEHSYTVLQRLVVKEQHRSQFTHSALIAVLASCPADYMTYNDPANSNHAVVARIFPH